MSNDFGAALADELTEYFASGTDIGAPETTYYVTLYDDTGSELNASLQNGRLALSNADINRNGTAIENAAELNFGEATADITVQEGAIKDIDDTDANSRVLLRADINTAPQDYADGTRVFFNAGELSFDILD